MDDTRLGFGLLGPLLLTVGGVPVSLGTPKQRAVLAVLLTNRNHAVGTSALIDAVWAQESTPGVKASVHSYVSNLRRLLGGGKGSEAPGVLVSAPPGYRLNVADGECDLDRFTAHKSAGIAAAAAGDFEQASSRLSAALDLWRGAFLADLQDFDFVEPLAVAMNEDRVQAQIARAEAEIACGRASGVIAELYALATAHPYREPLWAQLMTAYYVTERQSDALQAYGRLKCTLAEDLGIDPGPTVRALYERILRQEPLDIKKSAKTTAARALVGARSTCASAAADAELRDERGRVYPLLATITRIGRLLDNDIVLEDPEVSRHHAVIIDTGSSFVLTDLKSSNGVQLNGRHVHASAALADGDCFRICGREFTFRQT